jgi:signal transduction histidine kinase
MTRISTNPQTIIRALLYGAASALLLLDIVFLLKALITDNFIPIVPVLAGTFTAAGLLSIIYAEHTARQQDQRDHRNISRVAHQLLSPVHSLQEQLERLMENADTLPAEARLKLKQMETKTKVLLENIRDVFLTLQAQTGRISQDLKVYDLCALVKEAYNRSEPLASARNVELVYQVHCADAPVKVDRRLFLIALLHVIENAIVYTMTPGLVNIAVMRGKTHVRIIVQDRGIGLAVSEARRVWQPFVRGGSAEKYHAEGIGIGVTLTRLIIEEIDGSISWRNRERGMGTQFEIKLPLATTE